MYYYFHNPYIITGPLFFPQYFSFWTKFINEHAASFCLAYIIFNNCILNRKAAMMHWDTMVTVPKARCS